MAYSRGIALTDETTEQILAVAEQIAQKEGLERLSVKRILSEMKVSNRVFYNRFRNIDDVFQVLYERLVEDIRSTVAPPLEQGQSYCDYLLSLAVASVRKLYHNNLHFRRHLLSYEAEKSANQSWWLGQIQALLTGGIEQGLFRRMDVKGVSYGVFCFCLGFHKDAVGSNLSEEEAISAFTQSFAFLIEGMKQ